MENAERLYRSRTNKVIGGVSGGLADYFDVDVVLIRVVFVLLALFGGGGVLIYIVMWIIIPEQKTIWGDTQPHDYKKKDNFSTENSEGEIVVDKDNDIFAKKKKKSSNSGLVAGIILIFIGVVFLADRLMPWYNITDFWPMILVFIGVFMIKPDIFKPTKRQSNEI